MSHIGAQCDRFAGKQFRNGAQRNRPLGDTKWTLQRYVGRTDHTYVAAVRDLERNLGDTVCWVQRVPI